MKKEEIFIFDEYREKYFKTLTGIEIEMSEILPVMKELKSKGELTTVEKFALKHCDYRYNDLINQVVAINDNQKKYTPKTKKNKKKLVNTKFLVEPINYNENNGNIIVMCRFNHQDKPVKIMLEVDVDGQVDSSGRLSCFQREPFCGLGGLSTYKEIINDKLSDFDYVFNGELK